MDPQWIVVHSWDENNTLIYLFWMLPIQIGNQIHYSDCIFNNVTHKTNHHGMALLLFFRFDNH